MQWLTWLQQLLAFGNGAALQGLTIVVLIFTLVAAWKQARAATKLTEATERQIQTAAEQARAAKEQVEVARRQITESLRPVLVLGNAPVPQSGGGTLEILVRNEGLGVALDAWWTYGEPKGEPHERHYIHSGIITPKSERTFRARDSLIVQEGLLVVYESLAGVTSATRIKWIENGYHADYIPDITEWAKKLLGRALGPTN